MYSTSTIFTFSFGEKNFSVVTEQHVASVLALTSLYLLTKIITFKGPMRSIQPLSKGSWIKCRKISFPQEICQYNIEMGCQTNMWVISHNKSYTNKNSSLALSQLFDYIHIRNINPARLIKLMSDHFNVARCVSMRLKKKLETTQTYRADNYQFVEEKQHRVV